MEPAVIGMIVGSNGVVLIGIAIGGWRLASRIGKLEGRLEDGDYLRCPFYKKRNNDKKTK